MTFKPRIIHNMAETAEADLSLPDVRMAVYVRSEFRFRVIEMKRNDLPQANQRVYFADNRVPSFACANIVTSRE